MNSLEADFKQDISQLFDKINTISNQFERLIGKLETKDVICSERGQELKQLRQDMTTDIRRIESEVAILSKQIYAEMEKLNLDNQRRQQEQSQKIGNLERLAETTIATYRATENTKKEDKVENRQFLSSWKEWVMAIFLVVMWILNYMKH